MVSVQADHTPAANGKVLRNTTAKGSKKKGKRRVEEIITASEAAEQLDSMAVNGAPIEGEEEDDDDQLLGAKAAALAGGKATTAERKESDAGAAGGRPSPVEDVLAGTSGRGRADSVVMLLRQALRGEDVALLQKCLAVDNERVIKATVRPCCAMRRGYPPVQLNALFVLPALGTCYRNRGATTTRPAVDHLAASSSPFNELPSAAYWVV